MGPFWIVSYARKAVRNYAACWGFLWSKWDSSISALHGVQRSQDPFLPKAAEIQMAMTTLAYLSRQGQGTEILTTHMGVGPRTPVLRHGASPQGERKETTLT